MKWLTIMTPRRRLSLFTWLLAMAVALQFWYASRVTKSIIPTNTNDTMQYTTTAITHLHATPRANTTQLLPVTIDIMSVGSSSRPDYLQAQRETMGRYARFFVGVTEDDDHSEPHCSLTPLAAQQIAEHCKRDRSIPIEWDQPYSILYLRRQVYAQWSGFLSKKDNPGGWLCAQKRANDGLQIILQKFKHHTLPDYLILMDDDTFVDIPQLVHFLKTVYPDPMHPLVMAGCLIRFKESFTIPFGGFGTVLSKGALTRLLTPISCHDDHDSSRDDEFTQNACQRLQQNLFGEQQYFRTAMSLAELIHAYVSTHRLDEYSSWTNQSSFCVHSDWVWGYFFNYYNVGDPLDHPKYTHSYNRMTSYRLSEYHALKWGINLQQRMALEGQCRYKDSCPPEAHMCHYVTPEQIRQEGQRVFAETPWIHHSHKPIPIFLYPFWNQTMEHELKHFLHDGVQASSHLTLTQNHTTAPVWLVDVRRAGFNSKPFCSRFVQLVRSSNDKKRLVIFVYWDDDPIDDFLDCYRATRLLDSTTVFRYKRSIVQGRHWNQTLQFVEPGSVMTFGNWRDHSGGPLRHIGYGVRSDVVEGIESILNGQSIWEQERPVDISHFWPLPGQGDKQIFRGKASQLRDAVSQAIHNKLSQTQSVFVGVTGQAHEVGRNMAQSDYLRQLLQSKIVVVAQKDNWEDHYRLMEALVSGAMVMTDPMLTLPIELRENVSIVCYHSLDELVTKAKYYLEHEAERIAIANAGYNVAMNHYRSWHLVERMVLEVFRAAGVVIE